ncbi:oligosaccharide flippase family protein [Rhodoplanes sp. Z2-YC6860]|uniref:oligosaccharide flippase family protein n=1 Tax=Rhodoplanes sp. Z2-YC6860 TaxID=674703 RepID=UPI00078D01B3|nr:polysaccharide biosynthesis C-terminal domain-containing protein [Rhodoplanes sp. Z2-YC6860]AMN43508.1 polysaccharide biosynthesis protein [Rhodoplanes sp. Z2-YC6860]
MTVVEAPVEVPSSLFQRLTQLLMSQHKLVAMLKSAAQVLAIRVLGAGLTYASMVLLARWLGSHNFGIYAYVLVIVTLLGLAFSAGFQSSGLRFVSSYLARKRLHRLSGFLLQSHKIVLTVSVLGSMMGIGLVFALRNVIESYYVVPLLVGLLCVPIWTLLNQLEATARAFGWVNVAYIPGYILRPFLIMSFVGGLVLFGGAADAVTALWALIGACAVAALVQALLVYFGARPHLAGTKPARHTRYWVGISLSFLLIDGFRMLLDNTDILLIGRFLDPHSVAVYFAVIRTSGLVAFVSFSVIALAVPKFAEIHSTGTTQELQKFVSSVAKMMFWPSLMAAIAMACVGPFLLSLFGADFSAGYPTMLVVLCGHVLRSATLPVEYLLNMTGHHRDTMRVYAFAAVASIVLNLLLIPTLGITGAAIGTYTAMLGGNVWLYRLVRKRLGVDACVFPLMRATVTA